MATEMITVKLDHKFLKEIDLTVKKSNYQNRTEFIRSALRDKVEDAKLKEAMASIAHLKGASKKKTTEKEFEEMRERAFWEISKGLK